MKQAWKVALAYTAYSLAVLGTIALLTWAFPDEMTDYTFAYGMIIGASSYLVARVIDHASNRRRYVTEPEEA